MPFIYKISNDINEKLYIGKTMYSIEKRWQQHCHDMLKKKCENRPLYSAMRKYGIEHFFIEALEEINNLQLLNEREIYWIQYYDSYHNGYNATLGGDGKSYADYDLIYSLYTENNLNIKEIKEKTGHDPLTIKTALHLHNISNTDIHQRQLNRLCKPVAQIDIQTNKIIAIFPSCISACNAVTGDNNSRGGHISAVCKGKRKTAYGFKWQYVTNL